MTITRILGTDSPRNYPAVQNEMVDAIEALQGRTDVASLVDSDPTADVGAEIAQIITDASDGDVLYFRSRAYVTSQTITVDKPIGLIFENAMWRRDIGMPVPTGAYLTQADAAELDVLLDVHRAMKLQVCVDGNRDNNTASVTGVKINPNVHALNGEIATIHCDIGTHVFGAAESLNLDCYVSECGEGVREEDDVPSGDVTPDENNFNIFGHSNDGPWYRKVSNSNRMISWVHLAVEGTTGDGVSIEGASGLTTLTGMIRGCDGNGVVAETEIQAQGLAVSATGIGVWLKDGWGTARSVLNAPWIYGGTHHVVIGTDTTGPDGVDIISPLFHAAPAEYTVEVRAGAASGTHRLLFPRSLPTGTNTNEALSGAVELVESVGEFRPSEGPWAANDLQPTLPGPALGVNASTRAIYWTLPDGSSTGVGLTTDLPASWQTFDVVLRWTNPSASAGDVRFRTSRVFVDVGGSVGSGQTVDAPTAITAPAQNVVAETTLLSGVTALDGSLHLSIERVGSDGTDTLAANVAVLGVYLRRVT